MSLEVLAKQQAAVRARLHRTVETTVNAPHLENVHFLNMQKITIERLFEEYNAMQNQIYALLLPPDVEQPTIEQFVEFEADFNNAMLRLSEKIEALPKAEPAVSASRTSVQQAAQSYIPPLQVPLPTFDGSYEKWYSFKALFTTVMNRYQHEDPALKLFHLRNCLVGKAAGIIDDEIVNNNDYEAAWTILTQRFEDRRIIVEKHIENLLSLPKVCRENAAALRKVIDTCTKNVEALRNQNLCVDGLGEQMLVHSISSKLDKKLRIAWEAKQKKNVVVTYAAMLEFLEEQCRISERFDSNAKPAMESVKPKATPRGHAFVLNHPDKCPVCMAAHELWRCDNFKTKGVREKYDILKQYGACFNCLMKGHRTRSCSSSSCRHCGKKHHTLLHDNNNSPSTSSAAQITSDSMPRPAGQQMSPTTMCGKTDNSWMQTVLSTAVVMVDGLGNTRYPCRVLLDSASQMNFITEHVANLLSLKSTPTDCTVSGLNGIKSRITRRMRATIRSRDGEFATELDFLVTPRITGELPTNSFNISEWNISEELPLADPMFNQRGRIDMLIGAEQFWNILRDGRFELGANRPVLMNSTLGWVAGGVIASNATVVARTLCQTSENEQLSKLLKSFYELESGDQLSQTPKANEELCLEHFVRTHERTDEGRYVVRLPFNERKNELGDSREMALRRFLALERKLDTKPELKKLYSDFIREYEQLGHMREIKEAPNEDPASVFYLPHHCILRPLSTSTKLRVVFDGSAKTTTSVSINDALMVGPTIQNDLTTILLRFRGFQYVFTLDIPKMFRQVRVHPEDTRYQRIFWRYNSNECLSVRELLTVTYGLGCSPFHATMVLKQAAADYENEFPNAAKEINEGTYMDDLLIGSDSLSDAFQLQQEVIGLLKRACFDTHKWCANHPDLLRNITPDSRGNSFEVSSDKGGTIVKTLGVTWNPQEDWFAVSVPDFEDKEEITRRQLLSQLAKIFDPLGFFGPVVTRAKLILREVGELQLDWDDVLPSKISNEWRRFRIEMTELKTVQIPRWISQKDAVTLELHGFSDASDVAYGACLYVKSQIRHSETDMHLICSKSRILPMKRNRKEKAITTPRAELLAALLLSKLTAKFLNATLLHFETIHLWSDSQIVLAWLKKSPQQLQTFVANRTREIQTLTGMFHWGYVSTERNPADLVSRGTSPRELILSNKWWQVQPIINRPEATDEAEIPDESLPELRIGVALAMTASGYRLQIFEKMSSFNKMIRSLAYLIRLVKYIRSQKSEVVKGRLTAKELHAATLVAVRLVQRESFQPEIRALIDGAESKNRLNGLRAFWDSEDCILRVGGRLKRAVLPYDSRHQMLLPAKHPITEALIRKLHLEHLHLGQKGLLAVVRQRYWPLNVKSTIRQVIRKCVMCFKANPLKTIQLMGNLPSYRIQPAPVFANTGVDYAGPVWIKSSTKRNSAITKAYVCLFVCLQTRAIHLQLVSDLTTDAFLASLRRFISRRGCPKAMFSDNATNFAGAKAELQELWRLFRNECATKKIEDYCVNLGIEWSFIPPQSPHFGGIWEAGVKQVKNHLKRIVGDKKLSYEEFYTTLTQIEAVLNSRPLVPSSDDPSDYTAITPAHFLIGREMTAIPEPDYSHLNENRLSRWQLVQSLLQHFWGRWSMEYLPELQNRSKWKKTKIIKVGSLVLLIDRNAPPLQWPLGRISAAHPGDDGVTRVVTVRMASGKEVKRAETQICLLPLDEED